MAREDFKGVWAGGSARLFIYLFGKKSSLFSVLKSGLTFVFAEVSPDYVNKRFHFRRLKDDLPQKCHNRWSSRPLSLHWSPISRKRDPGFNRVWKLLSVQSHLKLSR